MAAVCDICGKGPGFGKSVSHSRPGGNKQRLNVCASCIKAGKVVRG
jgi:large subunit ribosomal protein L28